MNKSEYLRINEITAFFNALTENPAENKEKTINSLFNSLSEQDKEVAVNIVCMSLLKSVILNNEKDISDIDFDLSNGYSFQQWEELYFEGLHFKNAEDLFAASSFGYNLKNLYNSFSKKVLGEVFEQSDDLSAHYKKFGFKRQELNYFFLTNMKNFITENYEYVYPKITWMGQDEALFLTLPNVEPAKLKLLKEMIYLSDLLPGFRESFIKEEDVRDIFNYEIEEVSIDKMKQQVIAKSKSIKVKDKKMMLLDNVKELLVDLEPRLLNIIGLSSFDTNKKFLDKLMDESFKVKSSEDMNLPMIAISLSLMNEINLNQKNISSKLVLSDDYFNRLSNFSLFKEVSDNVFEFYIDVKQMKVLKKFLLNTGHSENKLGGPLEFVMEAEQENRVPHRRLARLLNEKVAEITMGASIVVEEEEQDGKLTGLYFVCKNVEAPGSLANAIKNYFIRYKYSFSYIANIGNINTDLNEYKKNVQMGKKSEEELKSDKDFMLSALKQKKHSLNYIDEKFKDVDILKKMMENNEYESMKKFSSKKESEYKSSSENEKESEHKSSGRSFKL